MSRLLSIPSYQQPLFKPPLHQANNYTYITKLLNTNGKTNFFSKRQQPQSSINRQNTAASGVIEKPALPHTASRLLRQYNSPDQPSSLA